MQRQNDLYEHDQEQGQEDRLHDKSYQKTTSRITSTSKQIDIQYKQMITASYSEKISHF